MSRFFTDTFYWGALFHQRDSWHDRVLAFSHTLTSDDELWTTDAVLTEMLAMFSRRKGGKSTLHAFSGKAEARVEQSTGAKSLRKRKGTDLFSKK